MLVAMLIAAAAAGMVGAACPCIYEEGDASLQCTGLSLTQVPGDCLETYPNAKSLNLSDNHITELDKNAFNSKADLLERVYINNNPLLSLHPEVFAGLPNLVEVSILSEAELLIQPKLFEANSKLTSVRLSKMLRLPFELFGPNLTAPLTLDVKARNPGIVIPCRTLRNLPAGSVIKDMTVGWAQTQDDARICNNMDITDVAISQCVKLSSGTVDCSDLTDYMTPVTVQLVEAEQSYYGISPPFTFIFESFHNLVGDIPDDTRCLPEGLDKIWDFVVYYQNSENIVLDTLYFDLKDLHYFISNMTKSVSIKADTVVLSQQTAPISYDLNISARRVILQYPLQVLVDLADHDPSIEGKFFTLLQEMVQIDGIVVEMFRHGNIHITVLDSQTVPCTTPPNATDILTRVMSLTQMDLAVQCSVSLQTGDIESIQEAFDISSWAETLAAANPIGGMEHVRSRAASVRSYTESMLTKINYTLPLPIPYLSLSIYSDMVDDLATNVQLFKDILDKLKDKLERQSEAMFDMSMSFEERHTDLEFVYQQSQAAQTQALSVLGSQQNHLNNLQSQADSSYGLIIDVYDKLNEAKTQYDIAFENFSDGIDKAQHNAFLRGCFGFLKTVGECIKGAKASKNETNRFPNPAEIVQSIYEAKDFKDEMNDMEDELQESMELISQLMSDVDAIMTKLESLDPPNSGSNTDWATAFPDTSNLLSAAQNQLVSRSQWDVMTRGSLILLDDADMKEVSGSAGYRATTLVLAEWGKAFSDKIVAFAQLILQIKGEEENQKVAELGVEQAAMKNQEIQQMLSITETNVNNYLSVMKQQNLLVMGMMLDFYTRTRADMLAMARMVDEYCQAYRYTFFKDCSSSAKPAPSDDYATILWKLTKLQVGALDSFNNLKPTPQPFKKTFKITEAFPCNGIISGCPVTAFKTSGTASLVLSDWWGLELQYFDRVRIDTLQVYLVGAEAPLDSSVILEVTQPAVIKDTFNGRLDTFTGHVTHCLIMYREGDLTDITDATFITDCSTHHMYDHYYSRTTPRGLYTIRIASHDLVTSGLESIQVHVEGSWMPHAALDDAISTY